MPVIHVKSLPLAESTAVDRLVTALAREFADTNGIDRGHVTVTWEFLPPGHYAVGDNAAPEQPCTSHPVLVDLLVPDCHPAGAIERMLRSVAAGIARHAGIPATGVFIHCRTAHPGCVFDRGEVIRW